MTSWEDLAVSALEVARAWNPCSTEHSEGAPFVRRPLNRAAMRLPPSSLVRQFHTQVALRERRRAETAEAMRNYMAFTVIPDPGVSFFEDTVLPMSKPGILAMYRVPQQFKPDLVALVGYRARLDGHRTLYGGQGDTLFAKDWTMGVGWKEFSRTLHVVRDVRLCLTGMAMDWAIELAATGRREVVERPTPPPVLLAFPKNHVPAAEETPAAWDRIMEVLHGQLALPDWMVEAEHVVTRIHGQHTPITTVNVRDFSGRDRRLKAPPWAEFVNKDLKEGDVVKGAVIRPKPFSTHSRAAVLSAVGPLGVDWLLKRALGAVTQFREVEHVVRPANEDEEAAYARGMFRLCPQSLVPSQADRSVGGYVDVKPLLGRRLPSWPEGRVEVNGGMADIQVVKLDRPPDRYSGLSYRDQVEGWLLDLAGLPKTYNWLAEARDT